MRIREFKADRMRIFNRYIGVAVWVTVILLSVTVLPTGAIASGPVLNATAGGESLMQAVPSVSAVGYLQAPEGSTQIQNPIGSRLVSPNLTTPDLFDISVNIVGGLTPSQQAIFTQAEELWESVIIGYQPGVDFYGSLVINAEGAAIDGVGGVLGSAGPTFVGWGGGFLVAVEGDMTFDSADLANMENNGTLADVIAHEMGHVIGLGTLWSSAGVGIPGYQEVYADGTGQYTGSAALEAYKSEFNQPLATFVPVELGGGTGTANGHWNEVDGGAGLTGITNAGGKDMRNELMTGWLNDPTFMSQTTISSFEDIGYLVVPEPATMSLLAMGGLALVRRRRRA